MKFRKFIGLLTALACMGTLTSSLSVSVSAETSAVTYDDCDVNQDGYVDISDAIMINRYLVGGYYVPDENQKRLDTNKNQIIDDADADCVMAKIMDYEYKATFLSRKSVLKNVPFSQYSLFVPDAGSSSTETREYARYNCKTKTETTYSLAPNLTTLSASEAVPYGQIGSTDDRKLSQNAPENTGIVQIEMRVPSTIGVTWIYTGTGFIVGNHKIATAAHCVYVAEDKVNSIKEGFYPIVAIKTYDSNGNLTGESLTPVESHIPVKYKNTKLTEYDYGLITVEEDLSEIDEETEKPKYVQFSLSTSYNVSDIMFDRVPLYVTGYKDNHLYTHEGSVYASTSNSAVLNYAIDTNNGQSGCPVYTITKQIIDGEESYVYTALAVHHGKGEKDNSISGAYLYNKGARMSKPLLQFYSNSDSTKIGW